jgi:hypothetical protein
MTGVEGGTDPYCPPAPAMSSDDAPFIIESDEELPAGRGMSAGMRMWVRDLSTSRSPKSLT